MADINFINRIENGYDVFIGPNPNIASGNKLVANIFQITFMTDIAKSFLSGGYGGNGVRTIKVGVTENVSPNFSDLTFISTLIKIAIDNTVRQMVAEQNRLGNLIPPEERIVSASLKELVKTGDRVTAIIRIVPETHQAVQEGALSVILPL